MERFKNLDLNSTLLSIMRTHMKLRSRIKNCIYPMSSDARSETWSSPKNVNPLFVSRGAYESCSKAIDQLVLAE